MYAFLHVEDSNRLPGEVTRTPITLSHTMFLHRRTQSVHRTQQTSPVKLAPLMSSLAHNPQFGSLVRSCRLPYRPEICKHPGQDTALARKFATKWPVYTHRADYGQ